MEHIVLNLDQQNSFEGIKQAIKDKHKFILLHGAAGTGKTTLAKYIADWYEKTYSNKIIVTAPTHQATRILADKTGREFKTIQALLGMKPNVDILNFDVNKPEFAQLAKPYLGKFNLVIIDEVSMFNTNLYKVLINSFNKTFTKDNNCLLLFLGDSNQLPPVNEKTAKVFIDNDVVKFKLTIPQRQNDTNPLMKYLHKLCESIEKRKPESFFPIESDLLINTME